MPACRRLSISRSDLLRALDLHDLSTVDRDHDGAIAKPNQRSTDQLELAFVTGRDRGGLIHGSLFGMGPVIGIGVASSLANTRTRRGATCTVSPGASASSAKRSAGIS